MIKIKVKAKELKAVKNEEFAKDTDPETLKNKLGIEGMRNEEV